MKTRNYRRAPRKRTHHRRGTTGTFPFVAIVLGLGTLVVIGMMLVQGLR